MKKNILFKYFKNLQIIQNIIKLKEYMVIRFHRDPLNVLIQCSMGLLVISLGIFMSTAIFSLQSDSLPKIDTMIEKTAEAVGPETGIEPLSEFIEPIKKKNLFKLIKKKRKKIQTKIPVRAKPEVKKLTISDLMKNLNLVGIITVGESQAIIEDKTKSKTYYLNVGDTINGITVQDILEQKVILSYKDETGELVL